MRYPLLLVSLITFACHTSGGGGGDEETSKPLPEPKPFREFSSDRHVVAVLDDGFDINHEVFREKILATYTLNCKESPEMLGDGDFATQKANMLKILASKDESCEYKEGITLNKSPSFASIASARDRWNNALLNKSLSSIGDKNNALKIAKIVGGEDDAFNYHGTGTAGLIAYKNQTVQFVMIQKKLGTSTSVTEAATSSCPKQAEIDEVTKIYADPDVVKAYVDRPLSNEEQGWLDIMKKHNVKIVNKSLGSLSRGALEKAMMSSLCGSLNFKGFFAAQHQLEKLREEKLWKEREAQDVPEYLTVQAAGNDGERIDGPEDTIECRDHSRLHILVGASTEYGTRASFSNYGECVDFDTLGSDVITAAPDNFLNIQSGTSFSTPLAVRHITMTFAVTDNAKDLMDKVLAEVDDKKKLKSTMVPAELAYNEASQKVDTYAIVSQPVETWLPFKVDNKVEPFKGELP